MSQMGFNFGEQARARNTDPWTSQAAAASLESSKIRASQEAILEFLKKYGSMDDGSLVKLYKGPPAQSPSGIRTRRAELVEKGLVRDSGKTITMPSGRKAIMWEAVE